jgi:large subunit ribosomal protein L18
MHKIKHNKTLAQKRKARVRGKINGTADRPRLSVFRSNKHVYLQVIDDEAGKTLVASNELSLVKSKKKVAGTKTERAIEVAKDLVAKMKKAKINKLKFDRSSYKYHGRLKAIAETLREAGVEV